MKLSINHKLTHLPLSQAKGTPSERLNKAIAYNDEFFKKVSSTFNYGDISPNIFKQLIQRSAKTDIPIEIARSQTLNGKTQLELNDLAEVSGYAITIPTEQIKGKISYSNVAVFMHETMHFFERILNPKYTQRDISIFNKKYNGNSLKEFYNEFLYTRRPLNKKAVDEFFKDKPAQEQIDLLQNIRYNLKLEQNAYKYSRKYLPLMKKQFKRAQFYPEKAPTFKDFHFEEKIKYLEEKLAAVIKSERAKLAKN